MCYLLQTEWKRILVAVDDGVQNITVTKKVKTKVRIEEHIECHF